MSIPIGDAIHYAVMLVGVVLWGGWAARQRKRSYADAPPPAATPLDASRPAEDPLHRMLIPACMLAYVLGAALAQYAFQRFIAPTLPPDAVETLKEIVPSMAGAVFGGAACVLLAVCVLADGIRTFGLRPALAHRHVAAGVAGWFMAYPICTGLLYVSVEVFHRFTTEPLPTHPALDTLVVGDVPAWGRALATVGPILIAPIAEELFFRGIVQSFLRVYFAQRWHVIAVSAVVFGLAHVGQPQNVVPLTALGVILAYLFEARRSLLAPIALHVVFNSYTITTQLLLRGPGP